ncbi:hypothetical protein [Thauera humireducens]|uniref:hypothetical protein n=1 Tax=Thauera humireducens TaxID=1134435 RepID=UPI00311D61DF
MEIRGEVYMRRDDFEAQPTPGGCGRQDLRQSSRRGGSIRQLDPAIAAKRPLSFFAYGLGDDRRQVPATHGEVLDAIAVFGLPGVRTPQGGAGATGLVEFHAHIARLRDSLPVRHRRRGTRSIRSSFSASSALTRELRWAVAHKWSGTGGS